MDAPHESERSSSGEERATAGADPRELLARFRERLLTGSYNAVIGQGLPRTLRAASRDTGLETEIGALRLALVRLLMEEDDPSRLAAGISRVAGVAVQAARLRGGPRADLDEMRALMLRELDAMEKECARDAPREKGSKTA